MSKAPVLIIVYNRVNHFKKCLDHLSKNKEIKDTDLFISSDGAKSKNDVKAVNQIRELSKSIKGFKSITLLTNEKNVGGSHATNSARDFIFNKYDSLITLEDDNIAGDLFLKYMNKALSFYKDSDEVFSISGFSPNILFDKKVENRVFFSNSFNAWGFGLWKKKYYEFKNFIDQPNLSQVIKVDLENKVLIRNLKDVSKAYIPHLYYCQKHNKKPEFDFSVSYFCTKNNFVNVYYTQTFIKNIGHDGSGERTLYNIDILNAMENAKFASFVPNLFDYDGVVENQIMNVYANKFLINELKLLLVKLNLFDLVKKAKLKLIKIRNN